MKENSSWIRWTAFLVFISLCTLPGRVSAVQVLEKEINGKNLKLDIFGFAQIKVESGDGVAEATDGSDDGLRVGADRVRLGYKAKWGKFFNMVQADFNRSDISKKTSGMPEILKNALVGYKFHDAASFQLGLIKSPVGMDFLTSGKKLDLTKRGIDSSLVTHEVVGGMLSGRKIGTGLGYDISYFNPPTRSKAVSDGTDGDQTAYAARLLYDMGKTLHTEASFGKSQEAGGAKTEDYKVWDIGLSYKFAGFTLKAEYMDGSDITGTKGKDQQVWYLHGAYKITPNLEGLVRHYQSEEDSTGVKGTDLSNTFVGLNYFMIPEKKDAVRIQLNYVFAGGDEEKWAGLGGFKDDAILAQFQVGF